MHSKTETVFLYLLMVLLAVIAATVITYAVTYSTYLRDRETACMAVGGQIATDIASGMEAGCYKVEVQYTPIQVLPWR